MKTSKIILSAFLMTAALSAVTPVQAANTGDKVAVQGYQDRIKMLSPKEIESWFVSKYRGPYGSYIDNFAGHNDKDARQNLKEMVEVHKAAIEMHEQAATKATMEKNSAQAYLASLQKPGLASSSKKKKEYNDSLAAANDWLTQANAAVEAAKANAAAHKKLAALHIEAKAQLEAMKILTGDIPSVTDWRKKTGY